MNGTLTLTSPGSTSYASALAAADQAAGAQHYPKATLYVVATPIGNLADMTLRALHTLQLADAVACEDTRHTASLLTQYGLHKPLLAVHQHNEAQAAQTVVDKLASGQRVAYVSDAGTPAVSDPGARLTRAVRAAGYRVVPLPGASSVTTLISAAGLVADDRTDATGVPASFTFAGFLPAKAKERDRAIQQLATQPQAFVILEAPHRIAELASSLSILNDRLLTVGRELTKQFEEIDTLPCAAFADWLRAQPQRAKGEFALVLHPLAAAAAQDGLPADALRTLHLLLAELPLKTAAKLAADITGQPRNALYEAALAHKAASQPAD